MNFIQQPTLWFWIVFVLIFSISIYFDLKNRNSRRRWTRIASMIIGLIALGALYLQPTVSTNQLKYKVAIVTDNADKKILDSLESIRYELIQDFNQYLRYDKPIENLVVVGDGLESWELDRIQHSYQFIASRITESGPFDYFCSKATINVPFELSLRVLVHQPTDISISGPGLKPQSLSLKPENDRLTFNLLSSLSGNFKYRIIGTAMRDTLFDEIIPVSIASNQPFGVLILTGAPSFEIKYLKNHLASFGAHIAERTQISKDTHRKSFINMPETSLSKVSNKLLERIQLLILDAESYDQLSSGEKNLVFNRLSTGELGILWMDEVGMNGIFSIQKTAKEKFGFEGLNGKADLFTKGIKSDGSERMLQNKPVAFSVEYGLGSILIPNLEQTYSWMLNGERNLYAQAWEALLSSIVGDRWIKKSFEFPSFPRVDNPVQLLALKPPTDSILTKLYSPAVREQWHLPGTSQFTIWPKEQGWLSPDIHNHFYVFGKNDWPVQSQLKKQTQTKLYETYALNKTNEPTKRIPISSWYFFIFFVISFGYLWMEQRLQS